MIIRPIQDGDISALADLAAKTFTETLKYLKNIDITI